MHGARLRKLALVSFVSKIMVLDAEIESVEARIAQKCREIPCTDDVLVIKGL